MHSKTIDFDSTHSEPSFRPLFAALAPMRTAAAGTLTRRDLQRIVAEMVD